MALLTNDDLRDIYESMVQPSGHQNPMQFMARILLNSGADPDYVGADGKVGLMPVLPSVATSMVGAPEAATLAGNLSATLAMDQLIFQNVTSEEMAYIKFELGVEASGHTRETKEEWKALPELTIQLRDKLYPPLATVEQVIRILTKRPDKVSKTRTAFYKKLIGER